MRSASTNSLGVSVFGFEIGWPPFLAAAVATTALAFLADHALAHAMTGLPRIELAIAGVLTLAGDAGLQAGLVVAAAAWAWNARRVARDDAAREWATIQLRRVLFVAAAVVLAVLLEEATSLLMSRARPSVFLSTGEDTLLPLGFRITGKWGSFPSGHATRAFAAAAAAWMAWGRMRWLLIALALGAAVSRVPLGRHFASDIVAGAWLGIASASLLRWGRAAVQQDRSDAPTSPN